MSLCFPSRAEITTAAPLLELWGSFSFCCEPQTIKKQCPVAVSSPAMQLMCYSCCLIALIGASASAGAAAAVSSASKLFFKKKRQITTIKSLHIPSFRHDCNITEAAEEPRWGSRNRTSLSNSVWIQSVFPLLCVREGKKEKQTDPLPPVQHCSSVLWFEILFWNISSIIKQIYGKKNKKKMCIWYVLVLPFSVRNGKKWKQQAGSASVRAFAGVYFQFRPG